ncbi:LysR family transcriptional regulator [Bradyrhizobium manausense]|uniref:LysR family transcriptional regulator n=1 Tax=Bradyrhizobium manausense TaxID=989370 RepID=UPI001BAD3D6A|nr:LysR family transcriptional regulator [Bradyrhizobium manausense]MBR0836905.1 LysR family transcriptional regulator [Bradyrhizobium manausense]
MNLRQIEVFRAVMIAGSVSEAARLLHISQPGVSRMLGHIQSQLGVTLFEHIKGRLNARPEAHTLFAEVEQVYRGVTRIEDCARKLKTGGGLSLKVLATPSMALELVPQAVADTSAHFPAARFYTQTQLVREILHQLLAGEADIAISSLPIEHTLIHCTPVGQWSLTCVFAASHPFAARRRISPRDILKERLIAFSPDTPQGQFIAKYCAKLKIKPDTRIEVRSGQTACSLAACGAGVAVVDSLTARAWRSPGLAFLPINEGPTFKAFAVRNASIATSLLAQTFVERVRAGFQRLKL